jgi:hypothetical protein
MRKTLGVIAILSVATTLSGCEASEEQFSALMKWVQIGSSNDYWLEKREQ